MAESDPRGPKERDHDSREVSVPRSGPGARAAARRRARTWAGAVLAVAAIAVAVLLYFGLVAPYLGYQPPGAPPPSTPGALVPVTQNLLQAGCNAVPSLTPSALLIPAPPPNVSLAPNGQITVSYQFGVVNYTSSDATVGLYLPSMAATFPSTSGLPLQVVIPPAEVQPSGPGWESPSFATHSTVFPGGGGFATSPAVLSTSRLAVMASAGYGQVALEFRWRWTVGEPNGTVLQGPWTVPTTQAAWPNSLPSIFLPAPMVSVLETTGTTGEIGSNYTAWLGGDTGGRSFLIELEPARTGVPLAKQTFVAPAGDPPSVPASIQLLGENGLLYPGAYLVHVHDSCGAILHSLTLDALYAPSATVGFVISPSSCGGIQLDQQTYVSGEKATLVPSSSPVPYTIGACGGASYTNRTTSGGLHILNDSALLVSASGSIAVTYP